SVSDGSRNRRAADEPATDGRMTLALIRSRNPPGPVMPSHEMLSTGRRGWDGDDGAAPATWAQSACVTGALMLQKAPPSVRRGFGAEPNRYGSPFVPATGTSSSTWSPSSARHL